MERQLTERHRLGVRLPRELVIGHPLQYSPGCLRFVLKFLNKYLGDAHRVSPFQCLGTFRVGSISSYSRGSVSGSVKPCLVLSHPLLHVLLGMTRVLHHVSMGSKVMRLQCLHPCFECFTVRSDVTEVAFKSSHDAYFYMKFARDTAGSNAGQCLIRPTCYLNAAKMMQPGPEWGPIAKRFSMSSVSFAQAARGRSAGTRAGREYWACVREEQRSRPGCPARQLNEQSRVQGTRERFGRRSGTDGSLCNSWLSAFAASRSRA